MQAWLWCRAVASCLALLSASVPPSCVALETGCGWCSYHIENSCTRVDDAEKLIVESRNPKIRPQGYPPRTSTDLAIMRPPFSLLQSLTIRSKPPRLISRRADEVVTGVAAGGEAELGAVEKAGTNGKP